MHLLQTRSYAAMIYNIVAKFKTSSTAAKRYFKASNSDGWSRKRIAHRTSKACRPRRPPRRPPRRRPRQVPPRVAMLCFLRSFLINHAGKTAETIHDGSQKKRTCVVSEYYRTSNIPGVPTAAPTSTSWPCLFVESKCCCKGFSENHEMF